MAGHKDDGCFIAQPVAVERLAGFRVARLEQHADHRLLAARQPLLALPDDAVEHPVDALGGAVHRRGLKARQPIRQPQQIGDIELPDLALIGAERGDDLGRVLGAEPRPEDRAADDFGGQRRHLAQGIDRRARRQLAPPRRRLGRRLDHRRREQRHARGMHDRRDDPPPPLPQIAIADEKAVTQKRRQGMTHLWRLALKALMQGDKRLRHRIRAVADKDPPVEDAGRKELVFEALLVEHAEKIAARRGHQRQRPHRLARARRVGRDKGAHCAELAGWPIARQVPRRSAGRRSPSPDAVSPKRSPSTASTISRPNSCACRSRRCGGIPAPGHST